MQLSTSRHHSHGKAIRHAVMFALGIWLAAPLAVAQSRIAAQELAERKAKVEEARELMARGDEAMAGELPAQALEAYAGAFELIPDVPALVELRAAAIERYVAAALTQSAALANRGDLVAAKQALDRVLAEDVAPRHPDALKMKEMLNDPVRVNPALTPGHHDNVGRVLELVEKANGAIALGRFDLAVQCYEDVLRIDPHNVHARRGLEQLVKLKGQASGAAYDQARAEMLLEVDRSWELSPKQPRDPDSALAQAGAVTGGAEARTVEAKLRQIMIPRMALDQVSLRDAIEFLRLTSSREDLETVDQSQRGINFTIDLGPPDSLVVQNIENLRFDLKLANVPVLQVLQYINELTGTTHVVDEYSVIIRPQGQTSDEVFVREYPVPADFIGALSEGLAGEVESNPFEQPAAGQGLLTERLSVQELLSRKGVSFPEGAGATYSAATNLLRVSNTADNHSIIGQIVAAIADADPVVISVQVTMIQTQQKHLTELGFDWLITPFDLGQNAFLGGGTTGNSGGRTVADFSSTIGLSGGADDLVNGVVTEGLRSGDRGFVADSIDDIINNPLRQTQASRVAPGILSLTGILSDGEAQLIMRGLDQKEGVDMLARPSVVTRSGESSKILLAREFIYPTEYDPPELQSGGGGGNTNGVAFPVVPANPTAFEMREVGISLEVLPVADDNKNYISVMLNPQIVEFDGFVNFGSPITVPVEDPLGGITRAVLTSNEILMPVFSTKRATSQLTIQDGATVAYGGLLSQKIQAIEDKVPVLGDLPLVGRLFRSESNLPLSTAIVFLVRVELMDPTGRRYRDLKTP